MNADASDGIKAGLSFGAPPPSSLNAISWTALVLGLVALIGGGSLLYLGFRRWSRNTTPLGDVGNAAVTQEIETPREPVGELNRTKRSLRPTTAVLVSPGNAGKPGGSAVTVASCPLGEFVRAWMVKEG